MPDTYPARPSTAARQNGASTGDTSLPAAGWFSALCALAHRLFSPLRPPRAQCDLRIAEMVPLGDKRFAAILQADGRRFLIGGTSNSIALLATLEETQEEKPAARNEFAGMIGASIERQQRQAF